MLLFWAVSCNKCWTQWSGSHPVRKWQQQEKHSSKLHDVNDGDRRNTAKMKSVASGKDRKEETAASQCGVPPRCLCPWSRRGVPVRASTLWRPQLSRQLIKLNLKAFGTVTFVGELWSQWLLSPKKTLKPLWWAMQIKTVARGPFTTERFGFFLGESQSCRETSSWLERSGSVVTVYFQESVGQCELKPRGTKQL